jgi:hypothetical protein
LTGGDRVRSVITTMALGRRSFLVGGAAVLAGAAGMRSLFTARREPRARATPFGPLVPDRHGILDLPPGFSYRVLEQKGDPMDDGYVVPARADGMACFALPDGRLALMRNHEIAGLVGGAHTGRPPPPEAYGPTHAGGVTRLVVDATTFERVSSNLVLTGTCINCAGGPSPWGWLSCEETTEPGHGYVFLCDAAATRVQPARRIAGYGRFKHEAAAVDPDSHVAYLTEDVNDGSFYRFVPAAKGTPFTGRLQALAVVGKDRLETGRAMAPGARLPIRWVDVADPDPADDTVRTQAQARGAAVFARGEGVWFSGGTAYVCATAGGPAGRGQIFRLVPDGSGGTLEVFAQSEDPDTLDFPDNITMSPWGDLYMAEDASGVAFLRGLTATGKLFDFARNALSDSEFAGVSFAPDGRALFVNIQDDGLTLAVTGPFRAVGAAG